MEVLKRKKKTLTIIKPNELLNNYIDDINNTNLEYGFSILKEKIVQLDEFVKRFYAKNSSKSFFPSLKIYMT